MPAVGGQCSREEDEELEVEKRRGVCWCFGVVRLETARGEEGRVMARMGCMRPVVVSGRRGGWEEGEEGAVVSCDGGGDGGKWKGALFEGVGAGRGRITGNVEDDCFCRRSMTI